MKPIIFSTPMVQAILDGRKTQTRRILRYQPPDDTYLIGPETYVASKIDKYGELVEGKEIYGAYADGYDWGIKCPYQPDDILWVRETWTYLGTSESNDPVFAYKAGSPHLVNNMWVRWRPSIHMPREAARIFLQVTNVRVERLQDITEEDARAEGCSTKILNDGWKYIGTLTARDEFIALWEHLNAKRGCGWDTNPWVWVVEFERIP